jgi:pimeloyl-ACP methyl ester carboxylesterase
VRIPLATGITAAYESRGDGPSLLLLHGAESSRRNFDVFVPVLGDGIRSITYDQRDTGDTTNGSSPYGFDELAADAAALIESLGIRPTHVLGTSFGGMLAQHLAISHPDLVTSLVLVSTTPGGALLEPELARLRERAVATASADTQARLAMTVDSALSADWQRSHPEAASELVAALTTRTPDQMARRAAAAFSHDTCDTLQSIKAPTLILQGTDDPIFPVSHARWMSQHIANCELVLLEGIRHGITFEARDHSARIVREFVLSNT